MTILQAAQESGFQSWIEDMVDILKTPPSLLTLTRIAVLRQSINIGEQEIEPVMDVFFQ